ncbi:hypothetical protein KO516_21495 [Citreicella sp. C3M06]|uniref:hypothetical protein n=1 Tax=Citreicella sp. C3M06 TaxID=2841564 RepID=UPI001C09AA7B|nr:hypothetical protein [Citreicella sp. C3M06]MBU2963351.1 hypothetical protein [Citreicella sp. C3M06]
MAIIAEFERDPNRSSFAVAEAAGCTANYARAIARREGIVCGRALKVPAKSTRNIAWLKDEAARLNLSVPALLDAIVTDARCEAEDGV